MKELCFEAGGFEIYNNSVNYYGASSVMMAKKDKEDYIIVVGESLGFEGEKCVYKGENAILAEKTHSNAKLLRKLFPFTAPTRGLKRGISIGTGDRLGLATDGHIAAVKKYPDVFPVFAQQSIRELNLTSRSYEDVLDTATFSVYKNGYKSGFGADGDHLKTIEEIQYALDCGYSLITLDLSEHIKSDLLDKSADNLFKQYIDKEIPLTEGHSVYISEEDTIEASIIYGEALEYIEKIYNSFIINNDVDFEISIDETAASTKPAHHYLIASHLVNKGIVFESLAPRFVGEFQKGIDYIGDVTEFEKELIIHQAIAKHFGYKLSVHSGSDKFSIFPIVAMHTDNKFHVKTAGTNWLEAVKLVAIKEPKFYRELHAYALSAFERARKYYVVTTNIDNIPALDTLSDDGLPKLFSNNDARQLLHITYGEILQAKDELGKYIYRDKFFDILKTHSDAYAELLSKHIGRHLEALLG
ncbi:MAG: tagaturonate epimerase family protein [Christensenellales bacterium]|jgi:hypothetical protein|nr:hypothetical protein [Christensenellaceae bacterium]